MRNPIFLFLLALSATSCLPTAVSAEWVELFDGKSLNGWRQRGGKATYRVEDGQIVGTSAPNTPNTYLCTE